MAQRCRLVRPRWNRKKTGRRERRIKEVERDDENEDEDVKKKEN